MTARLMPFQYDLDSVLRFEEFTVVEDKNRNRGPKAVQLRIRHLSIKLMAGHRAKPTVRQKAVGQSSDPTSSRKSSNASTTSTQGQLVKSESVPTRTPKAD